MTQGSPPTGLNGTYHGTTGGYSNHACRCEHCRLVWNAYCAGRRLGAKEKAVHGLSKDVGTAAHGTSGAYQKGCRCVVCKNGYNNALLESRYLLTSKQKQQIIDNQLGLCALCRKRPAIVVDHKHGTKEVRGILCHGCNTGLGKLGDSIEGLQKAIRYLEENPGKVYDDPDKLLAAQQKRAKAEKKRKDDEENRPTCRVSACSVKTNRLNAKLCSTHAKDYRYCASCAVALEKSAFTSKGGVYCRTCRQAYNEAYRAEN